MNQSNEGRAPSLGLALGVLAFVVTVIVYSVVILEMSPHVPIAFGTIFTSLVGCLFLKQKWADVESGICSAVSTAMGAILILLVIGGLIGAWVISGVVPGLIYYGLAILSPGIFLLASLLVCSIVSLATGSSWGTTGTIGIALMGISAGLGIPAPLTAGIVLSGAYFGDKMSPLSDTTNLAPAVSGANLFDHIKAMLWTTGPTYIIVAVIALILGLRYGGQTMDTTQIESMRMLLAAEFNISPLCFIPPLLVILSCAFKIPAMPGIIIGIVAALVLGPIQGVPFFDMANALQGGYSPTLSAAFAEAADLEAVAALMASNGIAGFTPEMAKNAGDLLSSLLARGGVDSMLWTVSLTIFALTLGGALEATGILHAVLQAILKNVRSAAGLITSSVIAGALSNVFMADQYLAIVLPGRMFKQAFEDKGLAPRMLSRSIEDSSTITSCLVPWNTCGAYQSGVLGVPVLSYLPYAFFNYLNPLVAIAVTWMGLGIYRRINGEDVLSQKGEAIPEKA